jgi:hypothetical protein
MSQLLDKKAQNLFEQRVRLVTAAGVQLPDECVALQKRLKDFQRDGGTPMRDKLVAALVDDDTAELPLLWALALAESSPNRPTSSKPSAVASTRKSAVSTRGTPTTSTANWPRSSTRQRKG